MELGYTLGIKPDKHIKERAVGVVRNNHTVGKASDGTPIERDGGLYDRRIFGHDKECYCKHIRGGVKGTCYCGVTVTDTETYKNNYAYFEGAVPWINPIGIDDFLNKLNASKIGGMRRFQSLLDVWATAFVLSTEQPEDMTDTIPITTTNSDLYWLTITDVVENTGLRFIGLIGLLTLGDCIVDGQSQEWLKDYINRCLEISSPYYRPYSVFGENNELAPSEITIRYSIFISLEMWMNYTDPNCPAHKRIEEGKLNSIDYAAGCFGLERVIQSIYDASSITAASKQSLIRNIYQQRVAKTARTNISIDPELELDQCRVPFSLAYEACKEDILNYLADNYPEEDEVKLYMSLDDRAAKACHTIVENGCVCLERPPTLHRYNNMSYKPILTDGITISLPPLTMEPFNADTDGDQMSCWFITDPDLAEKTLKRSSPRAFWFYEKSGSVIWRPTASYLIGLYYLTNPAGSLPENGEIKKFSSQEDVVDAFNNGEVEYDQRILLGVVKTTVGREIVGYILNVDLDEFLGKDVPVNAGNIQQILAHLYQFDDRYDLLKQLQDLSILVNTLNGTSTIGVSEIEILEDEIPEISEILKTDLPDSVKKEKCSEAVTHYLETAADRIPSLKDQLVGSDKIKYTALNELTLGKFNTDKDGNVTYDYDNLISGMTERSYIEHAITSRHISELKQKMVSSSGYVTRQLADLALDVIYDPDKKAEPQTGALMKAKYATGRQDIYGNIITSKGDELVRVKSNIFSKDLRIGSDCIRTDIFVYTKGAHIGVGMMTALSEANTQGGLELKHVGKLINLDSVPFVWTMNKPGTIKEISDRKLVIESGGTEYVYCIPVTCDKTSKMEVGTIVNKGDILFYSTNERRPNWKFLMIASLLGAAVPSQSLPFKTNAYAFEDGKIEYQWKGNGKVLVRVGNMPWCLTDDTCIYYYPNGAEVKKFDRIGDCIQDPAKLSDIPDIGEQFYLFHDQFLTAWGGEESAEIIEMVFFCMRNHGAIMPVSKIMKNERSMISSLNFGYCSKVIKDFYGKDIGNDFLTQFILNYDRKDENLNK